MLKIFLIIFLIKQYCSLELQSCKTAPPDQVCKLVDDYDKNIIPGKLPITLFPYLDIHEVVEIDVFKGTMTILLYIYVYWDDPNISYKPDKMLVHTLIIICISFVILSQFTSVFLIGKMESFHLGMTQQN